jgi:predicted transcriptional regulator
MTTDKMKGANEQLLTPIEMLVKNNLAQNASPNEIAQNIIKAIASSNAIFYAREGELSLLTAPARVLITLIMEPAITRRALSMYLGITEAAIQKSLNTLIKYGLIAKTKVGPRNVYEIDAKAFLNLSDISHIITAITSISAEEEEEDPF